MWRILAWPLFSRNLSLSRLVLCLVFMKQFASVPVSVFIKGPFPIRLVSQFAGLAKNQYFSEVQGPERYRATGRFEMHDKRRVWGLFPMQRAAKSRAATRTESSFIQPRRLSGTRSHITMYSAAIKRGVMAAGASHFGEGANVVKKHRFPILFGRFAFTI